MNKYDLYYSGKHPLPSRNLAWNLYGAGLENLGRNGQPEAVPIPQPGPKQMLVRVDCVGLCSSDIKIIRLGSAHPKLYGRDLQSEPTRLGHETAVTVIAVGEALKDRFYPGQRLAIQPDIFHQGKSTAYGYTIPGGLIQYHLIGPEVLETDAGACVLPIEADVSYAAAALLEPWGCVLAAYTQRRRLSPKVGGLMWIVGHPDDPTPYTWSVGLDAPATIVLSDVPPVIQEMVERSGAKVVVRNGLWIDDYSALAREMTGDKGFDDIVLLDPQDAAQVTAIAQLIARRGTLNLVGTKPLTDRVQVDAGRLHYDYIAFVGNPGPDIGASYGEARNRCELRAGGTAVFIGAGGPMGQMHVQRALELPNGPQTVIATEVNEERLQRLKQLFMPLAEQHGRTLLLHNPAKSEVPLAELVGQHSHGRGADDVVVCVPVASLMAEADDLMAPDGMLVFFAGVPYGTLVPLDLSRVYLHGAQYTGTSGLTIDDQRNVLHRALAGELSPERSVAAVGGMKAAREALAALMEGRYPGKIVIFPQIEDLPLLSLQELAERYPEIGSRLGPNLLWTKEAEAALVEKFWQVPEGVLS